MKKALESSWLLIICAFFIISLAAASYLTKSWVFLDFGVLVMFLMVGIGWQKL